MSSDDAPSIVSSIFSTILLILYTNIEKLNICYRYCTQALNIIEMGDVYLARGPAWTSPLCWVRLSDSSYMSWTIREQQPVWFSSHFSSTSLTLSETGLPTLWTAAPSSTSTWELMSGCRSGSDGTQSADSEHSLNISGNFFSHQNFHAPKLFRYSKDFLGSQRRETTLR